MAKMGGRGEMGQRRAKKVSETRSVKCCLDTKETEAKWIHGLGLGMPLVALGGLTRAGIYSMGFRIRAGFRL